MRRFFGRVVVLSPIWDHGIIAKTLPDPAQRRTLDLAGDFTAASSERLDREPVALGNDPDTKWTP
jgi:hypothetical protein